MNTHTPGALRAALSGAPPHTPGALRAALSGAPPHTPGAMRAPRIATWLIAFLVGAVYGLAGTIAHAYALGWFPLGLTLAIIGTGALLLAVRLLTNRWAALAAGLGMILATIVFSGRGPGGSVIVPQTGLAAAWTITVPILVAIIVFWPDRFRLGGARRASEAN